jgi:hypothetical protein
MNRFRAVIRITPVCPLRSRDVTHAKSHRLKFDVPSGELRTRLFVEGNPVNDGFVFWIRAGAYDLAVKILSNTPARGVLYGPG